MSTTPVHRSGRGRKALALTGTLLLLTVVLTAWAGRTAANARTRSPCEDGTAVGQICHYVSIESERPDYDATMTMVDNSDGAPVAGVAEWNEHNPKYTRWYWRYDEAMGDDPYFHLHLRIVVRGALTGIDTTIPGGQDTCYQIHATTKSIGTIDCPQSGL
ncbi:MAG TPA: hypothetical protein VI248_05405 [Kineosporiaceae bacterium]